MDAKFVEEYADEKGLTPSDRNVLLKMEEKAGAENRNICDYSTKEILECLRGYNSRSINTLQKYTSLLRQYIDYCIRNGKAKEKDPLSNPCGPIYQEELMTCLKTENTIYQTLRFHTVLDLAKKMQNSSDQFVILGSYEGLTLADILDLRARNFNFDESLIYHPKARRWFKHSFLLMQYGSKALDKYEYDTGLRDAVLEDVDSRGPSVIKKNSSVNGRPNTHTINSRIIRKVALIDAKFANITPKIINKFGFYQALRYCLIQNSTARFIRNENLEYRMLLERFGKELSRPSSIKAEYNLNRPVGTFDEEAYRYWGTLLPKDFYQIEISMKYGDNDYKKEP